MSIFISKIDVVKLDIAARVASAAIEVHCHLRCGRSDHMMVRHLANLDTGELHINVKRSNKREAYIFENSSIQYISFFLAINLSGIRN